MIKTNWKVFFGNSSTEEAIVLFVRGEYSFDDFIRACWPKECKRAIRQMKHKGYKKCRHNARHAINRRGFSLED